MINTIIILLIYQSLCPGPLSLKSYYADAVRANFNVLTTKKNPMWKNCKSKLDLIDLDTQHQQASDFGVIGFFFSFFSYKIEKRQLQLKFELNVKNAKTRNIFLGGESKSYL